MTPMVDLAFLLVTFFILASSFRPEEAVTIKIPGSFSTTALPDNSITVSVDSTGRVFFDMENKDVRKTLFTYMAKKYNINVTQADVDRFAVMGAFGQPMADIVKYIESSPDIRRTMNQQTAGIPIDSVKGDELADWLNQSVIADYASVEEKKAAGNKNAKSASFAIKADQLTKYKMINQVIKICQKQNITHFDLITAGNPKPKS